MSTAVLDLLEDSSPSKGKESAAPPEVALMQMLFAPLAAQAIHVVAKLGVADQLANGPRSINELAQETGSDASSLYRVLRALASFGVFAEKPNKVFELTPSADLLRTDVKGSLRDIAAFMGADWHWSVWGQLSYSVRTGKPAWDHVHGKAAFPYFSENKEAGRIFDDAMSSNSSLAIDALLKAYDFSQYGILVEVAGGHGRLLSAIVAATHGLKGILFDQPYVIEGAGEKLKNSPVASRIELQSGDFFVSVPRGGDAYLMKHIIHDWDDERALSILTNVKRAMNPGAKLLLVEVVITEENTADVGKFVDLEMLVSPGGKERTAQEYDELFARAGYRLTRIIPTESPYSVIEGVAS
ncbi:MAG TPA: methyltransferase [Pyrinomonadaceae bacterium]|nr:methyltransferase [Pyrinomonadaceae bacterium]